MIRKSQLFQYLVKPTQQIIPNIPETGHMSWQDKGVNQLSSLAESMISMVNTLKTKRLKIFKETFGR